MNFTNRQLVGGKKIKDDYDKINLNADEIEQDITTLYSQDVTLGDQLTQIINETALDPNKDPEVTNARTSSVYGAFATVKERADNTDLLLDDNINSLVGFGVNLKFPPTGYTKPTFDGVTDDTVEIQAIIDGISNARGGVGGTFIVPSDSTAVISNLTLPPACRLLGVNKHTSILKGKVGSTGKMITDKGNAAKVVVENLTLDGNEQSYTDLLDLGNNATQFGTEGELKNIYARDCATAIAFNINGNVATMTNLSTIFCKTGLYLKGAANKVNKIVTLGNTEYGIRDSSLNSTFSELEVEAPETGCQPVKFENDGHNINGLVISLKDLTTFDSLILTDSAQAFRVNIKGLTVVKPAGATYINKVKHNGIGYLKLGSYNDLGMNFETDKPQLVRMNEELAVTLTDRQLILDQTQPPVRVIVENDVTADVKVRLTGIISNTSNKELSVQNTSFSKTCFVSGANSRNFVGVNMEYDLTLGVPVRPKGKMSCIMGGGHISNVITEYQPTFNNVTTYPTDGIWYRGEIINETSTALSSGHIGKICTVGGDYSGTPPTWKFIDYTP